ncbi:hypothetical protein Daesc_009814 [Daldinia eschscholtzii]|uniref:Uncharacterized protein n=1 Tax=Daldinia eschscholtzii TaxID=292717 RepID=A0AAX6M6E3_9PEZI
MAHLSYTLPVGFSDPEAVSARHRRYPSPNLSRHYWYNTSNVTSDPQIFCHNESQTPMYTVTVLTKLTCDLVGDEDLGGPGVLLWNYDPKSHGAANGTMFFFYESNHDFVPYKYTTIPPLSSVFIAVCPTFRGRIVRGDITNLDGQKHLLGTWAEINWHANGSRNAWGDISLLQGNDGAAMIQSLDGLVREKGFTTDLVSNAPANLLAKKGTGSWCLDKIIGPGANNATREWERQFLDPRNVYLEDDIDPVINSENGRFQVTFFEGII